MTFRAKPWMLPACMAVALGGGTTASWVMGERTLARFHHMVHTEQAHAQQLTLLEQRVDQLQQQILQQTAATPAARAERVADAQTAARQARDALAQLRKAQADLASGEAKVAAGWRLSLATASACALFTLVMLGWWWRHGFTSARAHASQASLPGTVQAIDAAAQAAAAADLLREQASRLNQAVASFKVGHARLMAHAQAHGVAGDIIARVKASSRRTEGPAPQAPPPSPPPQPGDRESH